MVVEVVPAEVVERRYAVGETLERLDTASASEDPLTEIAEAGEQDCSSTES